MRLIRGIRVFIFKMIISEIRGDPLRKYFAIWEGGVSRRRVSYGPMLFTLANGHAWLSTAGSLFREISNSLAD